LREIKTKRPGVVSGHARLDASDQAESTRENAVRCIRHRVTALVWCFAALMFAGCSTSLLKVAEQGDLTKTRTLLGEGADPNEEDEQGMTPLMLAAENGHIEIVRELVNHGALVTYQSWDCGNLSVHTERTQGKTIWAVTYDGDFVASQMSESMFDLETTPLDSRISFDAEPRGPSAIGRAASSGHLAVVKYLLEQGATVDLGEPLVAAAASGHADIVRFLLDRGADVNAQWDECIPFLPSGAIWFFIGCRPLSEAVLGGHDEVAELLIERGADVNHFRFFIYMDDPPKIERLEVRTPLSCAEEGGRIQQMLKAAGAR
jgi:ankyrin repeat protein